MAELYDDADALVALHTTGTFSQLADGDPQPRPSRSTGVRASGTRLNSVGFVVLNGGIAGVEFLYFSPNCGLGSASVAAVAADQLTFSAPGDVAGAAVTIADGETKQLQSGSDISRYCIVRRSRNVDLAGDADLRLIETLNNALVGRDFSIQETAMPKASGTKANQSPSFPHPAGQRAFNVDPALSAVDGSFAGDRFRWTHPGSSWQGAEADVVDYQYDAGPPEAAWLETDVDWVPPPDLPLIQNIGAAFSIFELTGRLHCIVFENRHPSLNARVPRIWAPPVSLAAPTTTVSALGATGGGRLTLADATGFHPFTRFVRLVDQATLIETELVGGHLEGNDFVVAPDGRGLGLSNASAVSTPQFVEAHSGLVLGLDASGIMPAPTTLGAAGIEGADGYHPERVTFVGGQPVLPAVSGGWIRDPVLGVGGFGQIRPLQRVGIWLWLAAYPQMRYAPAAPAKIAWQFRLGAMGPTFAQESPLSYYRIANDLSSQRYRVYHSVGAGIPVNRTAPIAVSPTRPIAGVGPLVDDEINNLELVKVNDFGIEATVADGAGTFDLSGGALIQPPLAPSELNLTQSGIGQIAVSAFYHPILDPSPADTFDLEAQISGQAVQVSSSFSFDPAQSIVELATVIADASWQANVTVDVRLRTRRSSDGQVSGWVTASIALSAVTIGASTVDAIVDDRTLAREDG